MPALLQQEALGGTESCSSGEQFLLATMQQMVCLSIAPCKNLQGKVIAEVGHCEFNVLVNSMFRASGALGEFDVCGCGCC